MAPNMLTKTPVRPSKADQIDQLKSTSYLTRPMALIANAIVLEISSIAILLGGTYRMNASNTFRIFSSSCLTLEVTGCRSVKRGGCLKVQLLGCPVDREVELRHFHVARLGYNEPQEESSWQSQHFVSQEFIW